MDLEEFNEEEQIVYLTFREQFAIVVLIEELRDGPKNPTPHRLKEFQERLDGILEKIRPELEEAFKSLGETE